MSASWRLLHMTITTATINNLAEARNVCMA
jgi:hypothetical protein